MFPFGCAGIDFKVGESSVLFSSQTICTEHGVPPVVLGVTGDVKGNAPERTPLHPSPLQPPHPNLFYLLCFCVRFPLEKSDRSSFKTG